MTRLTEAYLETHNRPINTTVANINFISGTDSVELLTMGAGSEANIWGWIINAPADAAGEVSIQLSGAGFKADILTVYNNSTTGISATHLLPVPFKTSSVNKFVLSSSTPASGQALLFYEARIGNGLY